MYLVSALTGHDIRSPSRIEVSHLSDMVEDTGNSPKQPYLDAFQSRSATTQIPITTRPALQNNPFILNPPSYQLLIQRIEELIFADRIT